MKKILFVIDSLNSGGAERSLVSLLTLFDFKEYNIDLLMFTPEGLYLPLLPEEVNVLPVPTSILNTKRSFKYLLKKRQYKKIFTRLRISSGLRNPHLRQRMHTSQIIWRNISEQIDFLEEEYHCAIAYSQGLPTYYVAEKVKAKKKVCWVNTDYKIASYNKSFDEIFYRKFDKIIAVSELNKDIFINEMPFAKEKTCVIYDIISPELVRSMASEEGGFFDHYNGIRILTIGRLVDVKGYDMAIEASRELVKEGYKFKWYIIGEGPNKKKYESVIRNYGLEKHFVFLGTYHNPYTFLKQSDIYVQPSRYEGFGMAISEAKLLKKPIVATNFPVVYNQIKNMENGIIVDMKGRAVFEGIKLLLNNQGIIDKISRNLEKEGGGTEKEIKKLYSILG